MDWAAAHGGHDARTSPTSRACGGRRCYRRGVLEAVEPGCHEVGCEGGKVRYTGQSHCRRSHSLEFHTAGRDAKSHSQSANWTRAHT
eukprot:7141284-Prymnesium_polylepis.1